MFSALLALMVMPFSDLSKLRGIQFRPLSKIAFFIFIANFLILMQLGAKHVESPFIEFGQISTVLYFSHFLIIIPLLSILENSLIELIGEESLNDDVSYNNLVLQRSPEPIGIAVLGSAAVNGISGENATENEEETSGEE